MSYDGTDVFKMNGIAQATPQELRQLFSGRAEVKEPTKAWFTTQLFLYGILFKQSARKSDMREVLGKALKDGKVS